MAVNNKHNNKIGMIMVKKSLLSLAVAVAVTGLTGCNISSTDNNKQDQTGIKTGLNGSEPQIAAPLVNPVRGTAFPALASDLLYGFPKDADGNPVVATDADGTLYHADAYSTDSDGNRTLIPVGGDGYNPLFNALNEMDGVSTSAAMDIEMTGSVDVSSIQMGVNFFVIPLAYPTDGANPTGDPVKGAALGDDATPNVPGMLTADDVSFESVTYADTKKHALRMNFTKPLASKTRYLVIMTNGIKNVKGNALAAHKEYTTLLSDVATYVNAEATAAVAGLRAQLRVWDTSAKGVLSAVSSTHSSVLSYTFTTGGTLDVLSTMAAPGNANPALELAPGGTQKPVARTVDINDTIAGAGGVATTNVLGATDTSGAKFMSGTIELPYYLKAPAGAYTDDGITPAQGYACTADTTACAQAKLTAGYTIASQWEADDLTGLGLPAAPSTDVTRLYPFAKKQGTVSAPLLVVVPENAANTYGHTSGYPVVIFQHGITSNRTSALPLATQLAQAGFVTVAIDLPLHGVMPTDAAPSDSTGATPMFGPLLSATDLANAAVLGGDNDEAKAALIGGAALGERHFGLTRNGSEFAPTSVSATDASFNGSGSLFINLVHFQTSRDNLRQAVMDLMNLNASMANIETETGKDLDLTKTYFIGHSLGGIIGTTFLTVNNGNGPGHPTAGAGNAGLPPISGAILGMPGGGIPRLLEESKTFGPDIVASIKGGFELDQDGNSYTKLMYILQGTLDSVDPVNFAQTLGAIPTPITLVESIGDQVVPNMVARSPISGTSPLAKLMGLTQVDTSTTFALTPGDASTMHYWLRFNDADSSHSSLAKPVQADGTTADAAFAEIAAHAISLFKGTPALSNGDIIESASN